MAHFIVMSIEPFKKRRAPPDSPGGLFFIAVWGGCNRHGGTFTSKIRFCRLLKKLVQRFTHVNAQVLHGPKYFRAEPDSCLHSINIAFRSCHGLKYRGFWSLRQYKTKKSK